MNTIIASAIGLLMAYPVPPVSTIPRVKTGIMQTTISIPAIGMWNCKAPSSIQAGSVRLASSELVEKELIVTSCKAPLNPKWVERDDDIILNMKGWQSVYRVTNTYHVTRTELKKLQAEKMFPLALVLSIDTNTYAFIGAHKK